MANAPKRSVLRYRSRLAVADGHHRFGHVAAPFILGELHARGSRGEKRVAAEWRNTIGPDLYQLILKHSPEQLYEYRPGVRMRFSMEGAYDNSCNILWLSDGNTQ